MRFTACAATVVRVGATTALLAVLLAGCSPGDGRRGWTTAVDTLPNGAMRVVNTPPAGEIPTTWTIEEELRIGTVEGGGPASFGQIRGLAVTGDGRIARRIPGGDTTLVIETRRPPVPVTAGERDSAIDRVRSHLLERGARSARKDWSKIPDRKPSIAWILVADDGRLWVEATTADTLRTYDVYERDGRLAGTAVGSLDIWRAIDPIVRGDRLWAVVTDELDVPYVVRARLAEGGGGA